MITSPKKKPKKKNNSQSSKHSSEEVRKANKFLAYSSLAFELFLIMGLGIWGGWKLDQYFEIGTPVFLMAGSFLSLFMVFVYLYRKLPK